MRLSGIKLAGFKSFVDPVSLPLPSRLTSVVGPNGCGKSNLIDAVRWVLGEASIKNLRGADSEDVIFNGSRTRKAAGRASVELTFDNSDFQITGPYAAYAEIAVKRELARDGNSQYYLNGAKCLKRDVTDLFLGTGLGGKNQYAIIEQGMVSRMVEAKPEDLRLWLEETAGISKYKERRRETESRIRATRENLSRLTDLELELTNRLEVLVRQASNAEKYRQFKDEERRLKAELLLLRLRVLEAQADAQAASIGQHDSALEAARGALAEAAATRDAADAAQREAGAALNVEQGKVYEVEGQRARAEQTLAHARELKNLRLREIEQLEAQLHELGRRRDQEQLRLQSAEQARIAAAARAAESEAREAQAQARLAAADAELAERQQGWDAFAQRAQAPLLTAEGERVRVQAQQQALVQLDERLRRLRAEQAGLDRTPIEAALREAETELAALDRELTEAQTRREAADTELASARDARAAVETALHEARQGLQSARGRQASLETLQQAALRQDDAELAVWLRQHGLVERPRLAAAMRVEAGWETAVEHVLGGLLQAPMIAEWSAAIGAEGPKSGVAMMDAATDTIEVPQESLAARVGGPTALRGWLASIHAAADRTAADALAVTLPPGASVVSPDGVWQGRGWLRHPQIDPVHGGVIVRARLLQELKTQVEAQATAVTAHEQESNTLRTRQVQIDNERRGLVVRLDQTRARHAQRLAQRQAQVVRLEQTDARLAALAQDIDGLGGQQTRQAAELETARNRLTELEAVAEALRRERGELEQALAAARAAVHKARAEAQQATQARGQAALQQATAESTHAAIAQALASLAEQRAAVEAQRETRRSSGEELDAPIVARTAEVEAMRSAVAAARDKLRHAREALTMAEAAAAEAVRGLRAAEQRRDAAQERIQAARLEFENLRARREGAEALFAEAGIARAELAPALDEQIGQEDPVPEWEDRLATVGRRIDRLGAINLAAIQELDEGRTREAYLAAQHADVSQALATLEEAMAQLDGETQDRFKATFDQVNDIFKARFPQLFGGGEAYLEMTGEDLLSTGVKVMARPPGKRNSSIQLLSGGEKAMTAVALLLALFQLNPAPFCLMDEVDAPLDDANVGRFCEVVKEMAQGVQFIIITHNKITMELAEHLHGVTMQEPGVSRLVSVDVQQAVQLVGQQEEAAAA